MGLVNDYLQTFSAEDQAKVWGGNAVKFYGLIEGLKEDGRGGRRRAGFCFFGAGSFSWRIEKYHLLIASLHRNDVAAFPFFHER